MFNGDEHAKTNDYNYKHGNTLKAPKRNTKKTTDQWTTTGSTVGGL